MAENLVTSENKRRSRKAANSNGNPFREALEEQVSEEHKMSNRQAAVRDACSRIATIQAEVAALNADIREIKAKVIRGDLGWKLSNFALIYRFYALEGDDRSEALDTLKEGCAALGIGDLSFLDE